MWTNHNSNQVAYSLSAHQKLPIDKKILNTVTRAKSAYVEGLQICMLRQFKFYKPSWRIIKANSTQFVFLQSL